jgi:hypothetical protein
MELISPIFSPFLFSIFSLSLPDTLVLKTNFLSSHRVKREIVRDWRREQGRLFSHFYHLFLAWVGCFADYIVHSICILVGERKGDRRAGSDLRRGEFTNITNSYIALLLSQILILLGKFIMKPWHILHRYYHFYSI